MKEESLFNAEAAAVGRGHLVLEVKSEDEGRTLLGRATHSIK